MSFDIAAYLERIDLADRPPVTLTGLRTLLAAQLSCIAFENLETMLGDLPDMSAAGIWNKLVAGGRGGTALQLNSLLGSALAALGFRARPIMGRIGSEMPTAKSHLAWIVFVEGRNWLVDAGLGDYGPFTPIMESSRPQASSGAMFRVIAEARDENTLQRKAGESWTNLYSYRRSSIKQVGDEGAKASWSPDIRSSYSRDLIVSLHRPNGRLSIVNSFAKTEADMGMRVLEFSTAEAFARTIRGTFKLNYSVEELQRVWTSMRRSHDLHATDPDRREMDDADRHAAGMAARPLQRAETRH